MDTPRIMLLQNKQNELEFVHLAYEGACHEEP